LKVAFRIFTGGALELYPLAYKPLAKVVALQGGENATRRKIMMKGNRRYWQSLVTVIVVALWFMALANMDIDHE